MPRIHFDLRELQLACEALEFYADDASLTDDTMELALELSLLHLRLLEETRRMMEADHAARNREYGFTKDKGRHEW